MEGLNAVRARKTMLFSEQLWLELYGKVIESSFFFVFVFFFHNQVYANQFVDHVNICVKRDSLLGGMFSLLTQYLTPEDTFVRAAYPACTLSSLLPRLPTYILIYLTYT